MIFTHYHIPKQGRQRMQFLPNAWANLECAIAAEAEQVKATKAATDACSARVRAELESVTQRLACASSGSVQVSGVGGLRAEAKDAIESYLEISNRESAHFLAECLEFKKKLKPSVRAMIPLLDHRTGRVLPQKKNGAIAQWKSHLFI